MSLPLHVLLVAILTVSGIEMQKVIPEMLRQYTIELTDPKKEWHVVNHW